MCGECEGQCNDDLDCEPCLECMECIGSLSGFLPFTEAGVVNYVGKCGNG